jgi:hypothetical protein
VPVPVLLRRIAEVGCVREIDCGGLSRSSGHRKHKPPSSAGCQESHETLAAV